MNHDDFTRYTDRDPQGVAARWIRAARQESAPAAVRRRALGGLAMGALAPKGVAAGMKLGLGGASFVGLATLAVALTGAPAGARISEPSPANVTTVMTVPSTTTTISARSAPIADIESSPPRALDETPPPVAMSTSSPVPKLLPTRPSSVASSAIPLAAAPAATCTLAEEIARIDAARTALSAGDGAAALAALDRYARDVKEPRFVPEATLLRVEAMLALGRREEACALAARAFPHDTTGPRSAKIRSACP